MKGILGGLSVELSRDDLLWLLQQHNGAGFGMHYGSPLPEPHAPMDELTAIEERLDKRNRGAFVDDGDGGSNEARAAGEAAVDPGAGDPDVIPVPSTLPATPAS